MSDEHDDGYELLMPFPGTRSNGGPFDDEAFTAGWEMGVLWQRCKMLDAMEVPALMATIRRANVPQADLIAMSVGRNCHEITNSELDHEWAAVLITIEEVEP